MYCLLKLCSMCLKEKCNIINMHNASSVIEELRRIVNYFGLKAHRTMLICEECCERLRETYEFVTMCLKNSASFQCYVDLLTASNVRDSEANLLVKLENVKSVNYKIKGESEQDENMECQQYTTEVMTEQSKIDEGHICTSEGIKAKVKCDIEEANQTVDDHQIVAVKIADPITDRENAATNIEDYQIKEKNETEESHQFTDQCHFEIFIKNEVMRNIKETMEGKENNSEENGRTVNTGVKLFQCSTCNDRFTNKAHLTRHFRMHTVVRPYKCTKCHKCYIRKDHLVNHMRVHTAERPYKCSECHKCYIRKDHLNRHMRVHTAE